MQVEALDYYYTDCYICDEEFEYCGSSLKPVCEKCNDEISGEREI
jgi:hypothetical protein